IKDIMRDAIKQQNKVVRISPIEFGGTIVWDENIGQVTTVHKGSTEGAIDLIFGGLFTPNINVGPGQTVIGVMHTHLSMNMLGGGSFSSVDILNLIRGQYGRVMIAESPTNRYLMVVVDPVKAKDAYDNRRDAIKARYDSVYDAFKNVEVALDAAVRA